MFVIDLLLVTAVAALLGLLYGRGRHGRRRWPRWAAFVLGLAFAVFLAESWMFRAVHRLHWSAYAFLPLLLLVLGVLQLGETTPSTPATSTSPWHGSRSESAFAIAIFMSAAALVYVSLVALIYL